MFNWSFLYQIDANVEFLFNNIPVNGIKINKKPNRVLKIIVIRPKLGVSQENWRLPYWTKTTLYHQLNMALMHLQYSVVHKDVSRGHRWLDLQCVCVIYVSCNLCTKNVQFLHWTKTHQKWTQEETCGSINRCVQQKGCKAHGDVNLNIVRCTQYNNIRTLHQCAQWIHLSEQHCIILLLSYPYSSAVNRRWAPYADGTEMQKLLQP